MLGTVLKRPFDVAVGVRESFQRTEDRRCLVAGPAGFFARVAKPSLLLGLVLIDPTKVWQVQRHKQ